MGAEGADGSVYDLRSTDPAERLVDRAGFDPATVAEIGDLMAAMGRLRDVERKLAEAAGRYMKLNDTDMRALHFLIVARNTGEPATPSALARHLDITTASTTKMLDRLEHGGHVIRRPHPTDRRAVLVEITAETALAAEQTVGRQQATRFRPAAELSTEERATVIKFLTATAEALGQALDLDLGPDSRTTTTTIRAQRPEE